MAEANHVDVVILYAPTMRPYTGCSTMVDRDERIVRGVKKGRCGKWTARYHSPLTAYQRTFALDEQIVLQIADPRLGNALAELIHDVGCYCYQGEPGSLDIACIPCFAAVVDRTVLGIEEWRWFIEFRQEIVCQSLCVVTDEVPSLPLPRFDPHITQMQLTTPVDAVQVFERIRQHRRTYLNR